MDDVRRSLFLSLLFLTTAIGGFCQAVDFEYISPEKQKQLETEFQQAKKALSKDDLLNKEWKCDMFGMRSRLRVEREVKLYKFSKTESEELNNSGAQILDRYVLNQDGLIGKNDKVEDAVRMTSKGQLIARLSSLNPEKRVAAYSVCTAL